ncbi:hypothetical protein EDB83DRAFT_2320333 [Lactarius deliciosus]|nr:hypothetical protein EDB83DRAFT_2320333 [Lactarius deliciosus]
MGQYLLKKTIQKHHDSINALAFSPDGLFFASGANDDLIIIFLGNGSGHKVPSDVHTISLDGSTNGNPYYHTINCVPGPVHCIAENGIWLAVGSGKVIQLVKQAMISASTWECTCLLPDPIKFPELDGELPEPMACSLHFLSGGNLLLVMYLDHGVM